MPYSRITAAMMALAIALAGQAQAETADQEKFPPLVQAFFGSLMLDDQSGNWDDLDGEDIDVSFPSALPSGGIEAEYTYYVNDLLKLGLNSGGSIGWKNSDTRISGTIGGDSGANIRFELDNSLFLGELHLGGFLRGYIGPNVSLYAAAGPMIMYGQHRVENEDIVSPADDYEITIDDDKASSFAFGFYGRTGIDFQYSPGQSIGLGVRYMAAEMDFDDTVGSLDLRGPQFVLTYSASL